jgi:hypothetical protein
MFRISIILAVALAMTALCAVGADFSFRASESPEWNQMFQRTNGWLGADVAYSVPLGSDKTLWIFGDTFVGHIQDGKRTSAKMIHSSIATQQMGEEPQFYYPVDEQGAPQSLIKNLGPRTYFWLSDGARTEKGLYVFMQEVQWLNDTAWGFKCVGTWLASVENPDDPPALWKISTQKLPFTRLGTDRDVLLGLETLKSGNYVYIYGYSNRTNASAARSQIVARTSENDLGNTNSWEFYSNGTWTKDFEKTSSIFPRAGAEGSVSWQPYLKKFVFVYSDGIGGSISRKLSGLHRSNLKLSENAIC